MQCKHSLDDGPVEQRVQLLSNGTSYDTVQTYNWQWSTQRPNIVILQSCNYVHEDVSLYFGVETVRSLHKTQLFTVHIKARDPQTCLIAAAHNKQVPCHYCPQAAGGESLQQAGQLSIYWTSSQGQEKDGEGNGEGGVRRTWTWAWSRSLGTNTHFSLSEARNFLISRVTVNIWSITLPHVLGYNSWTDI